MIVLQVLTTLALGVATLLTLLLGAATQMFTARPPSGPDAMGLAGVFFGMGLRWILMLLAALVCVGMGRFDWLGGAGVPRPGVPTMVVLASMVGLGVVVGAGWMTWAGPVKPWTVAAGNLGGLLLPLVIQIYLLGLVWADGPAPWQRRVAYPRGGIAVLGLLMGVGFLVAWQMGVARSERAQFEANRQRDEENRRENAEREARQLAELEALTDETPLREWVTHLFIDKSEAHHARAMERMAALPELTARIDALMQDPDPLEREYCANYMRHVPEPDPAWAPIVRRALARLAEDIRAAPLLYDPPTQRTYRGMMMGMFMTARRFPGEDFTAEGKLVREAVESHPDEINREACVALADRFLSGAPLKDR